MSEDALIDPGPKSLDHATRVIQPPMDRILSERDHRPYGMPEGPHAMTMRWHDLLFAHWPVSVESLRPHVPAGLEIETFGGSAWLGVVPFRMRGVRPRLVPERLGMAFPELNVRTYVRSGKRAGVWFFSLDATSKLAVRGARFSFGLPYFDARVRCSRDGAYIDFSSERTHRRAAQAQLAVTYGPTGQAFHAAPDTLDYFLTERYCLFSVLRDGTLSYCDIHHLPWPLQPAEAAWQTNSMGRQIGIALPEAAPVLHFARHLYMAAWAPRPL
ncbi:DUF2071 domain-containing protein [soil metagenome]